MASLAELLPLRFTTFSRDGLAASRSKSNNYFSTAAVENWQILRQIPSEMSI